MIGIDRQDIIHNINNFKTDISNLETICDSRISVYLDTNTNISTGTDTVVPFETELYDGLGEFDIATHRFTAENTGYYSVKTGVKIDDLDDKDAGAIKVFKNATLIRQYATRQPIDTRDAWIHGTCDVYLEAGDYVEIKAWHDEGGTQVMVGEQKATFLDIHRFA